MGTADTPAEPIKGLTLPLVSQLLAAASCLAALGVLLWQLFRKHEKEKLYVNMVAAAEAAAAEAIPESEDTDNPEETE